MVADYVKALQIAYALLFGLCKSVLLYSALLINKRNITSRFILMAGIEVTAHLTSRFLENLYYYAL